jgi:hypothetical protein
VAEGRLQDRRGTAGLLRLPDRALAPPAYDQPNRVRRRSGKGEDRHNEGAGLSAGWVGDDLQADGSGRGEVKEANRISSGSPGEGRSEDREQRVSRSKCTVGTRRVTGKSNPQHLTIPR